MLRPVQPPAFPFRPIGRGYVMAVTNGSRAPGGKTPDPTDVEVGNRIKLLRRSSGLSQQALGDAVGVTFQQIQKYEKGTNRVGAGRLKAIADALGVPVAHFFLDQPQSDDSDGNRVSNELIRFIRTDEGRDLNIAFDRIASRRIRRRIAELVNTLADEELDAGRAE